MLSHAEAGKISEQCPTNDQYSHNCVLSTRLIRKAIGRIHKPSSSSATERRGRLAPEEEINREVGLVGLGFIACRDEPKYGIFQHDSRQEGNEIIMCFIVIAPVIKVFFSTPRVRGLAITLQLTISPRQMLARRAVIAVE